MRVDRHPPAFAIAGAERSASDAGAPCASVVVFDDLVAVANLWLALQDVVPVSPYQTWDWVRSWFETEGIALKVMPMIVVAYDAEKRVTALLPLGLRRSGLARTAIFLGGRHANYNMGLFAPGPVWTERDVASLLHRAARALPRRLDVYALVNQPVTWEGEANPLALLPHQRSPSSCHRAVLTADPESFFRVHQSSQARKKLRSKLKHLGTIGPVRHQVARSADEIAAVLDAHVAQKAARLAAMGAADWVTTPVQRAMLDHASAPRSGMPAPLELHALLCGDRVVATFGGLTHRGRFSGMLISYDAEPDIAKGSPGEQLLTEVVAAKCREGFAGFDLGIGESRYKENYCPITDPLFDSFVPLTWRGRGFVVRESLRLILKGRIKRSAWTWSLIQRFRRLRVRLGRPPRG